MVSENKMFKIRLISKAVLFGISVLFLLFVAVSTSPLTEFYGWDSSYFMLVGQGMTKGLLPYRDFFDMKGPYMYLIEYIAQKICWGRTGCFLMEVVHLTASLWIIEETFGIVLQEKSLKKYGKYIYIYNTYSVCCQFRVRTRQFNGGILPSLAFRRGLLRGAVL